jgi:hypothetical protein
METARQLTLVTETLRLPRPELAAFTEQGLAISPEASESDLIALGSRLFAVRSWTKWGLGSVFAAMLSKRPHPDQAGHPGEYDTGWVSDFADAHHLDPKERRELIGVALFYGGVSPSPHLSFEHHREAMWAVSNLAPSGGNSPAIPVNDTGGILRKSRANSPSSPAPVLLPAPVELHGGAQPIAPTDFQLSPPPSSGQEGAHLIPGPPSLATGVALPPPDHSTHIPAPTHGTFPTDTPVHQSPPPLFADGGSQQSASQRASALAYLAEADRRGLTLSQFRAHIRQTQRTQKPEQRELALAAYSVVFDFHRFAARELAAIATLKPDRARMILSDLGSESLAFIAELQRLAAVVRP